MASNFGSSSLSIFLNIDAKHNEHSFGGDGETVGLQRADTEELPAMQGVSGLTHAQCRCTGNNHTNGEMVGMDMPRIMSGGFAGPEKDNLLI